MENVKPEVVVLGAGIVGLQTALALLKAGTKVTILAKFWPGDKDINYTSPWAGAQWRANIDINDLAQQKWNKETYFQWQEEAKRYEPTESGLEMHTAVLYWDSANAESEDPEHQLWYSSFIPAFHRLSVSSLPPDTGIIGGISYETYCLSPTSFLQHRLRQCRELGAITETAELQSLDDVFKIQSCSSAAGIVNCTGLSAGKLVPDENMFPTKGQTIIVKGKAERISIRVGGKWDAFIIPQPGTNTTLLGGCKLPNDWTSSVDDGITQWILDRCTSLAPELLNEDGYFDILSCQAGLRPTRRGGPRVDVEWLKTKNGLKRFICHNYGHGSSGYEDSVGTANDATALVIQALESLSRDSMCRI